MGALNFTLYGTFIQLECKGKKMPNWLEAKQRLTQREPFKIAEEKKNTLTYLLHLIIHSCDASVAAEANTASEPFHSPLRGNKEAHADINWEATLQFHFTSVKLRRPVSRAGNE